MFCSLGIVLISLLIRFAGSNLANIWLLFNKRLYCVSPGMFKNRLHFHAASDDLWPLIVYLFLWSSPHSSVWITSLGCITGTPVHTLAPHTVTSAGRRCLGSRLTGCPVKVWLLFMTHFRMVYIISLWRLFWTAVYVCVVQCVNLKLTSAVQSVPLITVNGRHWHLLGKTYWRMRTGWVNILMFFVVCTVGCSELYATLSFISVQTT